MKPAGALAVLLLIAPVSLHAQSFCEPVTADPLVNPVVLGDGTPGSVTTAAIQSALNAGGQILFNVGTSPTTITVTSTLTINRAVVLDGGGVVTLSGGGVRQILQIAPQPSAGYGITLQNISFSNGRVNAGRGGAISNATGGFWQRVSLKLVNCAFNNNSAQPEGQDDGGGALYATGLDHVRIGNSTFTNNTGSNGGAVYSLVSRRVTIVDTVFTGNSATGTGANPGNGGNAGAVGIDGDDRLVDICRTRFVNNTSNAHGAGFFSVMYDSTSRTRFEDTTFEGNRQLSDTEHTGGAYIQDGPFAFERVSFLRNEARGFGGLFITGARAAGTIRNATFVGNVARQGLGAAMAIGQTSPVSIVNTTIANNVSTEAFAAGISVGSPNQLRLTNVILANNTGGNAFVSWGINNTAAFDGGGNMQWPRTRPNGGNETRMTLTPDPELFVSPLLAPADADNGGAVPTIALTSASPARDSGVSGAEVPPTDARGLSRVGPPDRGSYEIVPSLSIGDVSVTEGNSGTTTAVFTLTLSQAASQAVTVNFATANGSAVAPGDYTTTSGARSFAPGTVTQTVNVPVVGDTAIEGDETFFVSLGGAVGATIGDALGVGTIVNDDLPSLSISDVSLAEGSSGTTNAVFTLTLSQPAPFAVSVNFATANGSAVAPGDYTAVSGSRSLAPGTVTQTISVPVVGDLAIEENEVFFVSLGGPSGATISDALGVGTIVGDDLPSMAISDISVVEGNSGTTSAVFTLTLSQAAPFAVSVNFATANGSAVAPGDYTAVTGPRTFSPGAVTQTIDVPVVGDLAIEENETFFVSLGGASGATISDALGVGTITNDDLPTLSVSDVVITEGNAGSQNAVFTVSLSQAVSQTVTVNYGVAAGTATAGEDFGTAAGTLIFPGGTTTLPAEVPVFGDWIAESSETFTLNLSAPTGATLADGTGAGTITDDDTPGLTINDAVVRERPIPSSATVTFTVTLAPASGAPVTVNYATADGTATVGSDYLLGSGALTFAPGETTRPVSVTVNADALVEGMETFVVNLSGATGAAIAHGTGTGQILDPPLGGDFNADGNTDLVWRHDVSGQNVIWHMDGTTLLGGTFTTPATLADTGWRIVGTNDFNANGRPDLLWRHAVSGQNVLWHMNGAVMQGGTFLTPAALADVNWGMSGTGDFNLDGRPDILWRHAVSGQIVVWYMGGADGSVLQSGEFLTPSAFADTNWQTVGTGDFNLDGHTDILWRHAVAGQNVVWFMKGSKLMNGAFLNPPALVDVNWRMVATGDYNDDGKVDIVWRHSVSGQNVLWFMDAINMTGGGFTDTLADANWRIVGPR